MDPTVVAAISGALASLATEVAKGVANEAGKDTWDKIKALLGSQSSSAIEKIQNEVVIHLEANQYDVTKQVVELLKLSESKNVSQLVGSITSEKVVVASNINALNM